MGWRTDAHLGAFAAATGIKPAVGDRRDRLDRLQALALDVIRLVELEKAGICDGAGSWIGSEPIGATIQNLAAAWADLGEVT